VISATNAYLEAEDAVANWIEDQCERDPNARERSNVLFAAFKAWAEANNEFVGTSKRLAQSLERHGVIAERTNKYRGFRGLRLVGDATRYQP
jgi:phage/plasmid-associated DNA primase